jgi:hypothetical protein
VLRVIQWKQKQNNLTQTRFLPIQTKPWGSDLPRRTKEPAVIIGTWELRQENETYLVFLEHDFGDFFSLILRHKTPFRDQCWMRRHFLCQFQLIYWILQHEFIVVLGGEKRKRFCKYFLPRR